MKSIYVLLTKSPTILSRMIACFTGAKYTHASLAFDRNLTQMYSFGRKYSRLILPANMRHEQLDTGFFKTFNKLPCVLLEIEVEDEAYESALKITKELYTNKKQYSFNILGMIFCGMKIDMPRKNKYFCSQFVSSVLKDANIINIDKNPCLVKPIDFLKMEEFKVVFEGRLNALNVETS